MAIANITPVEIKMINHVANCNKCNKCNRTSHEKCSKNQCGVCCDCGTHRGELHRKQRFAMHRKTHPNYKKCAKNDCFNLSPKKCERDFCGICCGCQAH